MPVYLRALDLAQLLLNTLLYCFRNRDVQTETRIIDLSVWDEKVSQICGYLI
jgi:hypothetical protein